MANKNSFFKLRYVISISIFAIGMTSYAQPDKAVPVVENMYGKKVKAVPKEVLKWDFDEKKIPEGFVRLNNKGFTLVYPKCFETLAQYDEEDQGVLEAPAVSFSKNAKCNFVEDDKDDNRISIGYSVGYQFLKLEMAPSVGLPLLQQKMTINGVPAMKLASVIDTCANKVCKPRLRREIFLICKGKTMSMLSDAPEGKISEDLISKDNFEFPRVFIQMISSFRCK